MSCFERFHVVTGGPGSGKSTVIDALGRAGYARTIEAGRAIIEDQVAIDGPALPWRKHTRRGRAHLRGDDRCLFELRL